MFEIKTAGNFLDSSNFESLRYAIEHINPTPKLIIVMGHTKCGAITACYDYLTNSNHQHLKTNFPGIINSLAKPTTHAIAKHPHDRDKAIHEAAYENAKIEAECIVSKFYDILQEKGIAIYHGMYDINTGEV